MQTLSLFLTVAGFVIGHGAVTVIDLHGFLGRTNSYWNEATIRTHKITKPLIWIGMALVGLGTYLASASGLLTHTESALRFGLIGILVLNGCFLTFVVSPALLKREREGKATELLPKTFQKKIAQSFVISFLGWWSLVYLFVSHLVYITK
jgi:hypothetical protein